MSEQEVQGVVEMCWRVACDARLKGHDMPMIVGVGQSQMPGVMGMILDTVQYGTYQALLGCLLPHNIHTRFEKDREPWQGEEGSEP